MSRISAGCFSKSQRRLSGTPGRPPGQEKNEPHTEEGILPVKSFWNPWQRVPAHFLWAGLRKPLRDHIAWGHLQEVPSTAASQLPFLAFSSAIWSTSWKSFQSYTSYGETQLEEGLGKYRCLELALWQTLEDRCPLHIWETSLWICLCFLVLAQMVYVWEKSTGQTVRQWGIFSK